MTANTAHQLSDVLWTEIDKWARKLPEGFKQLLEFKSDKISLKGASDSFAVARTSRRENPEALQGFHPRICYFCVKKRQVYRMLSFKSVRARCPQPVRRR